MESHSLQFDATPGHKSPMLREIDVQKLRFGGIEKPQLSRLIATGKFIQRENALQEWLQ
jgi:hypothetical protein